jgi:uncharacterized cupin superfamily protein
VVNLTELEPESDAQGSRFGYADRRLGRAAGGEGLGCTWFEVPPGKTTFPLHYHCNNEEAAFILEGEGRLRIGKDTVPIRAGDYLAFPAGPESVHQIINTGTGPLRYLGLSTLHPVDVVGYPDSNKILARYVREEPVVRAVFRAETAVDYYDREKID